MQVLDTIAAISTPPGRSGIGVVRLSGVSSLAIAHNFVRLPRKPEPRYSQFGRLVDPEGTTVDEVVVTWFAAPRSYTGEDVVEISCHGSPAVLEYCLGQAIQYGARLAEPGEFTLRAYLRGKIDLPQAEAVRDLIDATTLYQAKVAAQQKQGALSRRLNPIKSQLIDLIALLEAGIDFAEDDVSVAPPDEIVRRIDPVLAGVVRMAKSFAWGRLVKEGFSIAIAGAPNAGKSSLFNALLNQDRAIVTPIPGTTRDAVSETMEIGGIPCRLVDTAGIRETAEMVESLGIERSFEAIADASVTLVIVDASAQDFEREARLEEGEGARDLIERAGGERRCLLVANKCDLPHPPLPPGFLEVSALTGAGIEDLKLAIIELLHPGVDRMEPVFVTSLRQKNLLDESERMLSKARIAAQDGTPHEMLLLDLYCALEPLDAISGKTTADDILNQIFTTFCIGK